MKGKVPQAYNEQGGILRLKKEIEIKKKNKF
jgi:hypothetical protein